MLPKPTILAHGDHYTAGLMNPGHKEDIRVNRDGIQIGHCPECGFTKQYPSKYELSLVDYNPVNNTSVTYLERMEHQHGRIATDRKR